MGSAPKNNLGKRAKVPLYDYQRDWITDPARFKIGLFCRQAGKSFSTSLEAVLDCFKHKTKWVFLSAGERQSKELMLTAQTHARAVQAGLDIIEGTFSEAAGGGSYKQLEIAFPNGSRIVGLPANPATARGHSANILLDEFAFHQDSRAIWRALFPTITRGYKIRIISTPQGRKNKFYEICSGNDNFSKHKITIFDAVAQGLELKDDRGESCGPEALEKALGDPDGWQQEYLCEFLDEATAFLTYELISEGEVVGLDPRRETPELMGGPLYVGVDIGRKKDLTVFWLVETVGDVLWTRQILELERMTFADQKAAIWGAIEKFQPRRVCMDATGLGMQLAEETQTRFGSWRVEPVTFTGRVKEDLATTLRRRFEDHQLRLPVDQKVREDLHNVKRTVTSSGNIRFDADRTEDGHADRFWALALAAHAATSPAREISYQTVAGRRDLSERPESNRMAMTAAEQDRDADAKAS